MEKKNLGRISEKYKNINNMGSPVDSFKNVNNAGSPVDSFADSLPESFGSTPESWKSYDLDTMSSQERYRLLISAVIPRPVALITSINQNNIVNCAPFSYTSIICHDPPLVSSSINLSNGKEEHKDNIEKREFIY